MYKTERESEILEIMESNGYVTVEYLAQKLHISPSSVRRDLAVLEQKGLLRRSYGGAEISDSANRNTPFSLRSHENAASKKRIARAAVKLVKEGDVVFVDGSSTAFFLFEELVSVKGITIVTNSIDGLFFLSSYGVRALSTGGMISPDNRAVLVGEAVKNTFSAMRADIAFFSVASLGRTGDLFDFDLPGSFCFPFPRSSISRFSGLCPPFQAADLFCAVCFLSFCAFFHAFPGITHRVFRSFSHYADRPVSAVIKGKAYRRTIFRGLFGTG